MKYGVLWLLVVVTFLYLYFPCAVFECDAVIYSCAGLSGDTVQSTDAGHLAWGFLEMGAADLGRGLQPPLNQIYLLRYLAIFCAVAGAWVFYRLARELEMNSIEAFTITGVLALSYSYWHFGIQAESHLVSTFFLICFAWSAFRYFRDGSLIQTVMAGVYLSLATLMHQTCILLVPAFLIPIWWRERSPGRTIPTVGSFLFVYFLLVIVPYLGVGWFVRDLRSYAEFREWILGLSLWGSWGQWSMKSLPGAVVGAGRSLVGSHYLLGIEWVREWAYRIVPNASWEDEIALARTVSPTMRNLLFAVQVGIFLVFVSGLWNGLRRLARQASEFGVFALFLGLWLAIYTPFIIWWAPIRAEFWIAVFVPLLLLFGRGLVLAASFGGRLRFAPVLLVISLAAVNLLGSIQPQSRADVEPELARLVAIEAVVQPGDFLLSDSALQGRATRFVYSLDKVNLLHPQPHRSSQMSPGAEGGAVAAVPGNDAQNLIPIQETEDPIARAVCVVAAVADIAAAEGRSVYLAMAPLTDNPGQDTEYEFIVQAVIDLFELSEPVPTRTDVELREVLAARAQD
jgi:hypothetical protein